MSQSPPGPLDHLEAVSGLDKPRTATNVFQQAKNVEEEYCAASKKEQAALSQWIEDIEKAISDAVRIAEPFHEYQSKLPGEEGRDLKDYVEARIKFFALEQEIASLRKTRDEKIASMEGDMFPFYKQLPDQPTRAPDMLKDYCEHLALLKQTVRNYNLSTITLALELPCSVFVSDSQTRHN